MPLRTVRFSRRVEKQQRWETSFAYEGWSDSMTQGTSAKKVVREIVARDLLGYGD